GSGTADIDFGGEVVTVGDNDGAAGNPTYSIVVDDSDYYEVAVSAGDLVVSAATRVIIFGINPVE
ncbi:MAG: hypothetical protein IJL42_09700, partial [Bacteroidales bacterium]|nr:hypothetical protein [Bacteroidales bacterium]